MLRFQLLDNYHSVRFAQNHSIRRITRLSNS